MKLGDARVILRVANILKKSARRSRPLGRLGQPGIVAMNWGLNMLGFLYSPVTWTLIILILSGLGIFRELL